MDQQPGHFIGEPITVGFGKLPMTVKSPPCPDWFTWREQTYTVVEMLSAWRDFRRRGRMARNMRPSSMAKARRRGSWGVGRFYFRVRTESGRVFDLYYDRAPSSAGDRMGSWTLYRELDAPESEL